MILTALIGLLNFLPDYAVNPECAEKMGAELMSGCMNIMIFSAIFAALFLGTDYSDGTIRNKLTVGHTRAEIYFAGLITTAAGGTVILAAQWAVTLAAGLCLGGKLGMPAGEFMLNVAVCLCAVIALNAVFTELGMLLSSKSMIVTVTLLLSFGLGIGGAVIWSMLDQPEYIAAYGVTADGSFSQMEQRPNPMYVDGVKRDILTAVNDVLPGGQMVQMSSGSAHNAELMPLYSLGVFAAATAAGALVFRRKDLK